MRTRMELAHARPRAMAWIDCLGSTPCAWDPNGRLTRYVENEWAPLPKPPACVAYGGPVGDANHKLLDAPSLEAMLHFELIAVVVAASPELQRSLPLENLPMDALPAEFLPEVALHGTFVDAVRGGLCDEASLVYVAPDAYGGHGLFAAVDLPKHALVGEYVGALHRGVCALDMEVDPYLMCYPSAPGALYLSGKHAGSLMRFVNHAPLGDPANNCKCVAILVDGAYHLCLVTTCAVAAREEFAFDYGPVYWTKQRSTCKTSTPAPSTLASDTSSEAN